MNKMKNIGKYMVATLMLLGISACSNDSDGLLVSEKTEISRTSELISEEVTLSAAGTLSTTLTKDPATLQKLKITGPINAADVQYWKTNLTNLVEFDLSDAIPTYTEEVYYKDPSGNDCSLWEKQVGDHMFSYMTKLEKIVFPTIVTSIGSSACAECTALSSADIPANVTYIGYDAFHSCAFTSVTIPETVTSLGSSVFKNNQELQTLHFLANTNYVPYYGFQDCPKLTTVVLNPTIERLNGQSFYRCSSLKDYTPFLNIKNIEWNVFSETAFETVDLTNVNEMQGSFQNCKSLKSVVLPPLMTEIPNDAFHGCDSLVNITWPTALEKIGYGAFENAGFVELTLPATVKSIGNSCFYNNSSLTKITLPEGLETIGSSAFYRAALTEVVIPSTVTTIGSYAFNYTPITEIVIPSSVTSIGSGAFQNTKLKMLTVPETVTAVEGSLVNGCDDLRALVWNCAVPVDDASSSVSSRCYLYIPNADVVVGPNWKNIIIDGVMENLVLCENGNRTSSAFSVPIAFKVKKISFSRNFNKTTYPGVSSGWQTIVLPFTPTKIEHESKGVVAPFNSGVEGAKPFWLRELTADGFVDKTTIEPDKAYIIAMPNHDVYAEEYCLNGKITFSAENVDIPATPETLAPSVGPDYSLQPTYQYIERGVSIYALNADYRIDEYRYGSVFARNITDIYAFEAYATLDGRSARSIFELDTRSSSTRGVPYQPNKSGIPQIGDM